MQRRRRTRGLELPARRDFLVQSAAAIAGFSLGCGDNQAPPTSRLGLGIIGVGGIGTQHLAGFLQHPGVEVIAIADVDRVHLAAAKARGTGLHDYTDYRELLARADIDAVVVATPDHWHVQASVDAANAGKHIYCEKPLTLTIAEGRTLVDAVRAAGVAFQTGSQQRSIYEFQLACEIVRNGGIGQLVSMETAVTQGPFGTPVAGEPQPDTLDWDMWLGPAPAVPYHQLRVAAFRYFNDYGYGTITDLGAHEVDIAQWGSGHDMSGPAKVSATAVFPPGNVYESPSTFDVHYTYANGVTLRFTTTPSVLEPWYVHFVGTDGDLVVDGGSIMASRPEILDYRLGSGPVVLGNGLGHYENWLDAIVEGTRAIADVEVGHRTATLCHLAHIAIELGRELTWDPPTEQFVGDPEAQARVSRPRRAPWTLG